MAVEAHHMNNLFPPQIIITNRNLINHHQGILTNNDATCTQNINFAGVPAYTRAPEGIIPYGKSIISEYRISSLNKSESGLTHHFVDASPRKRRREYPCAAGTSEADALIFAGSAQKRRNSSGFGTLIGGDVVDDQIQLQQLEMDSLVAQHMEKLRAEIEERRMRQTRTLTSAIGHVISKKLKDKDDEIHRMQNLNWVLQERVKNLCLENQILRNLSQTTEATVITLRRRISAAAAATEVCDDVLSSCGSCGGDEAEYNVDGGGGGYGGGGGCRRCGVREAGVLLLPCRHLCLCTACGSSPVLLTCPVCGMVMNASVHVNMS